MSSHTRRAAARWSPQDRMVDSVPTVPNAPMATCHTMGSTRTRSVCADPGALVEGSRGASERRRRLRERRQRRGRRRTERTLHERAPRDHLRALMRSSTSPSFLISSPAAPSCRRAAPAAPAGSVHAREPPACRDFAGCCRGPRRRRHRPRHWRGWETLASAGSVTGLSGGRSTRAAPGPKIRFNAAGSVSSITI